MTAAEYTASILADDGESLTTIDLRDLDERELEDLRVDAAAHGDTDLVRTIDAVIDEGWGRAQTYSTHDEAITEVIHAPLLAVGEDPDSYDVDTLASELIERVGAGTTRYGFRAALPPADLDAFWAAADRARRP